MTVVRWNNMIQGSFGFALIRSTAYRRKLRGKKKKQKQRKKKQPAGFLAKMLL